MHFTDEQKAHIDQLIERRLITDRRRHDREVKTLTDERDRLRASVDRLTTEVVKTRDELQAQRQRGIIGRVGAGVREWLTGSEP